MMNATNRRCRACGVGRVKPLVNGDRRFSYRTLENLRLREAVAIPTCDYCGAEWIDEPTAEAIDSGLQRVFRDELHARTNAALDSIVAVISQRQLERLLGLSQGYLSKLRAGERDPSPDLLGLLGLIARDPAERIRELKEFWVTAQGPTGNVRSVSAPSDAPEVRPTIWTDQATAGQGATNQAHVRVWNASVRSTTGRQTTSRAA